MYAQVIQEWKAYDQLSGDRDDSEIMSAMEQGLRSAGWKGALTQVIEATKAHRKTNPESSYGHAYYLAYMYAQLGDKEQAFQWLNTALQEHDEGLLALRTDFLLDPIRSDPRFAELVRKVGLPQ